MRNLGYFIRRALLKADFNFCFFWLVSSLSTEIRHPIDNRSIEVSGELVNLGAVGLEFLCGVVAIVRVNRDAAPIQEVLSQPPDFVFKPHRVIGRSNPLVSLNQLSTLTLEWS